MKTRYKIPIIVVIAFLLILFIPPNVAAFSRNTLKNKDLHCHLVGMTFFGIPFQTSIYHWFEWSDPLPCGGVKAHPDKMYPCIGIVDYWGYPPRFSPFAELVDFEPEPQTERKIFCEKHEGKWSDEFQNCVGGSIETSCDDVGASEFKPPNVFGKVISEEGICVSHEVFCKTMGGNSACMSDEQKGHGRDICIAVCEFE